MTTKHIPDEQLAAYIDGFLSRANAENVSASLAGDKTAFDEYLLAAKAAALDDVSTGGVQDLFDHPSMAGFGASFYAAESLSRPGSGVWGNSDENYFQSGDRFSFPADSKYENNNQLNFKDMKPGVIGTENPIQQHGEDTCAIKSQQIILQEFGIPVTEEQLVEFSIAHGLYNGEGTNPADVGILLNQGGIPTTTIQNADVFDLTSELAQGHKVIVGVDSGELWDKGIAEWWEDLWNGDAADHALIVAGIDNSDPNNPQVLLTDPGSGELCKSYPLDQFMDAWQDSNCMMVTTNISPVDFAAQQMAAGEPAMHLSSIAGNSYGDFQLFHDISSSLPDLSTWDYMNYGPHPVGSLVDAYQDYAHKDLSFQDIMGHDYDFVNYFDPAAFTQHYVNTLQSNMETMMQNPLFPHSDITNMIDGNPNADMLQSYFETQVVHFGDMGEQDLSDFFNQQVHLNEFCHDFGINPLDIYTHI